MSKQVIHQQAPKEGGILAAAEAALSRAEHAQAAPDLNRLSSAMQAGMAAETRGAADAGEPYPAMDHAILYAYEERGRRLHARVSADLLLDGLRWLAESAKRTLVTPLRQWFETDRRRQELARLDDRMLRDIGLTRGEIGYVAQYGLSRAR